MRRVILAVSFGLVFLAGVLLGQGSPTPPAAPAGGDPSTSFVAAAKRAQPAVVHLIVTRLVRYRDPYEDFYADEFARRFFRRRPSPVGRETSMGSGVIVDPKGVILTNAHVVKDAHEIVAKLPDGRQFKASSFAVNEGVDLAVVRIDGEGLPAAELGDSDGLQVGQWVIAIGNPFGLEQTVTSGIVSALRKGPGEDAEAFIQTDAPINPGNSGGPLIDLQGRVVGINTAIYSKSGGYQGIGFALPINLAKKLFRREF
jgi:serine protease Do